MPVFAQHPAGRLPMLKKIAAGALVAIVLVSAGLLFWARSILAHDAVRAALASQISKAIGQPVSIGGISATIYPRVTANLTAVTIGEPARIRVDTLHLGTDFGALLSRRIEHGRVRLTGARVELPLPPFSNGSSKGGSSGAPPVEIVSIDEVALSDVEIVSGSRVLRADIDLVPHGSGVVIRKMALRAGNAALDITGRITDLSGPSGELAVKAGVLNLDQLMAFLSDFSRGAPTGASEGGKPSAESPSRASFVVSLNADRATLGGLALEKLAGKAQVTGQHVRLQPITFGIFGGRYDGTLALTLGEMPAFRGTATLSGVDVAAVSRFGGSPDTISGRLSGRIDLAGRGTDSSTILRSSRGTARVDIVNGVVRNLGLLRTVVVATSMRSDASSRLKSGSRDEPFSRLGATLTIANGVATTNDLRFEGHDATLDAAGAVHLNGSAIDLHGHVRLSEELSQQAGRDLVRYTQEQGRVTLPAAVTGSATDPKVRIDVEDLAKRAVVNRATEEAKKVFKKGFGGLFKR
jgi:uncharacterized protein involved in outer membrane biogenesis